MPRSVSRKPLSQREQQAENKPAALGKVGEELSRNPKDMSAGNERQSRDNTNMLKELAQSATNVVARAASILEEEIAAGVVAAKGIEGRFVDVRSAGAGKPEEVLPRFRRDAHDVVDIIMDLLNVATRTLSGLTQSVIRISGEPSPANKSPMSRQAPVPTVSPAESAHAGMTAELSMSLENDGDTPTEEFAFYATDLVNPSGHRIAASHITFTPSTLIIPPHDRVRLSINIAVPESASVGIYTGMLQATRLSQLRAIILVPLE
jgi:hypothetical protein